MSHLTSNATAIGLGASVGLTAGLYTRQALRKAAAHGPSEHPSPLASAWLLAVIGGVSGVLIGARFGMQARLPAYLYLAAITPALGALDAATRTLPNRILLPAYPTTAALLGFAAWRDGDAAALWHGTLAGIVLYAVFLVVAMAAPGSMGFGDVLTELAKVRR